MSTENEDVAALTNRHIRFADTRESGPLSELRTVA